MIVITPTMMMNIAFILLVITTAIYVGFVINLYLKNNLGLFLGITIVTGLVIAFTWFIALSFPCTGYQMIQLGSDSFTPEMCRRAGF